MCLMRLFELGPKERKGPRKCGGEMCCMPTLTAWLDYDCCAFSQRQGYAGYALSKLCADTYRRTDKAAGRTGSSIYIWVLVDNRAKDELVWDPMRQLQNATKFLSSWEECYCHRWWVVCQTWEYRNARCTGLLLSGANIELKGSCSARNS